MRRLLSPVAVAVVLATTGCSYVSRRECRATDWTALGNVHASAGLPAQIGDYQEECRARGVAIDPSRYGAGYEAGLARYCTPAGAYQAGRRGDEYEGVCGTRADDRFRKALRDGAEMWAYRTRVRELRRDLDLMGLSTETHEQEDTQRLRRLDGERRLRWLLAEAEAYDRRNARAYGAPPLAPFEIER